MDSIDIVIPCYRYGRYLRECVNSVLTQGVDKLRILIIDDESPDETPAIGQALARQDTRVTYRRHLVNRGHIATYNEGIEWTHAECMLLLSADDYLLPGALERAFAVMRDPEVGLCFGDAIELHDDGSTHPVRVNLAGVDADRTVLSGRGFIGLCAAAGSTNIVPTPTAVVRTRLLKQLGGYRADLPHSGDLELWLRLAAHSSVAVVRAPQAVYRRHAGNMSNAYYADGFLLDLEQRKAAFDAFRQRCASVLPHADHLHRGLLQPLARAAVSHASAAFNDNRRALSKRLCEFARNCDPEVGRTLAWRMLACKNLMGWHLSNALLPAADRVRSATARLRS